MKLAQSVIAAEGAPQAESEGKSGFDFRPSWLATAKHLRGMLKGERHTEAVSDCRHCTIKYAAITLEELAAGRHFTRAVDAHAAMSTQAESEGKQDERIEAAAREEAKREFRAWLRRRFDDHVTFRPKREAMFDEVADKAASIFADTTLRADCERLVGEWRKKNESAFSYDCAAELSALLAEGK